MKILNIKVILSIVVVLFINGCALAQPKVDHDSILRTLQKYDPSLKRNHFVSTSVDLNDDKCADSIVLMNRHSRYCGSRGCVMLVMVCQDNELKPIGKISYVSPIVSLSKQKTLGFKNIDVVVRPKGVAPYQATLQYNGKAYPVSALFAKPIKRRNLDRILFQAR
ncbi:hypothetical protein MNB_SV-15-350 [hydrothermal vent metagenome]|uniref:Uncharacterized protein n=1 Tax=hydrothermal vent metagenome TaxID=652676 RepID=A0A1W1EIH5_9ZZZZ